MQPQRPKRLPKDFFDRLLSNQTDDQINDLLSSLVDEQIAPSADEEKETSYFDSSAALFEPAEAPVVTREMPYNSMADSILGDEDGFDSADELEPERPMDGLIPPTTHMRETGNFADTIIEELNSKSEDVDMLFPGVPDDPTTLAASEPVIDPGLFSEQSPVIEEETEAAPVAGDDFLNVPLPETSEVAQQEPGEAALNVSQFIEDIPLASQEDTAFQTNTEVPDMAGYQQKESYDETPLTEPFITEGLTSEMSSEGFFRPESLPTPEGDGEKILSHQELIHAKMKRRWGRPKRKPKQPKLAVVAPEVVIDQTRISALDDYLQDRRKAKEAFIFGRIQRTAIWFILPAFIAFSLFSWYPMLKGLFLSFFNFQPGGDSVFIGLQNYMRAFKDIMFLKTLWHGGLFCGLALLFGFVPPIFLAIFVNEFRRGKSLVKFLFFLPFLMPTVPAAILWKWIMDQGYGLLNAMIALLPIADPHIGWLTNPNLAMLSIVLLYVWKNTGWAMLIYSAALLNVDPTLYEEAEIHGASIWQKIRHITLPTIKGTIAVMFIITVINTIQLFTEVYIMTNGGPMNSTEVLATYIYKQAFFHMDIGYASALSIIMLVMLLMITIFRLRRLD